MDTAVLRGLTVAEQVELSDPLLPIALLAAIESRRTAVACLVAFVSGLVPAVHSICAAQLHGQHCIVGRGRGRAHWPWSCAAWWRGRWWRGVGWLPWGRGGRWRHCLPSLLGTRMHNVRRGQVWPTSACALHTAGAPARRLFSTAGSTIFDMACGMEKTVGWVASARAG